MVYATKPTLATNYNVPTVDYADNDFQQLLNKHFRIQQNVQEYKHKAFLEQKKYFDRRMHMRDFQVGDVVFAKNFASGKFDIRWRGPFRVVALLGNGNVQIENLVNGRRYVVHSNLLKPGSAGEQVSRQTAESYKTAIKSDSAGEEDECSVQFRREQGNKMPNAAVDRQRDPRNTLQKTGQVGRPPDGGANSRTSAAEQNAKVFEPPSASTRSKKQISNEHFKSLLHTIYKWQQRKCGTT